MKTEALEGKTLRHSISAACASAGRSSELYLESAKSAANANASQALEAAAIKRAVIADQLQQIASKRYKMGSIDAQTSEGRTHRIDTPGKANFQLQSECKRLYRSCEDTRFKAFLRDVINGL